MDLNQFNTIDVILLCGLPGAGKSHCARQYLQNKDRKRINRQEVRKHLYESHTLGENGKEEWFKEVVALQIILY